MTKGRTSNQSSKGEAAKQERAVRGKQGKGTGESQKQEPLRPPEDDPVYRLMLMRGFNFVQGEKDTDGTIAYGYAHKDGRALLHLYGVAWQLREPDGSERGGRDYKLLAQALKTSRAAVATKKQVLRTVARQEQSAAERKAVIAKAPEPETAAVINAVREATEGTFALKRLRGDAQYGVRLNIAKRLLGKEVRVSDAALVALTKRLHAFVGLKPDAPAAEFVARCTQIHEAAKAAAVAERAEWREAKKKGLAATRDERTVPGPAPVLPPRKKTAAEQLEEMEALKAELEAKKLRREKGETPSSTSAAYEPKDDGNGAASTDPGVQRAKATYEHVTGKQLVDPDNPPYAVLNDEQAPTPRTDSDGEAPPLDAPYFVPADCALLEHRDTGVVLLRLALPGLHGGAPCVYNNGREVSLGIVNLETLSKFRVIEKADVQTAARQLLKPIVPSVKISNVAESHLTAVMHCKELTPMATETNTKKFAAPAKTATKKATKTAKAETTKKEKVTKAQKGEPHAPRSNGYAGKKIKVINKDHGAREGTKRAKGMDIILKAKTTDEAIPALTKAGCDNTFIAYAVKAGFIELV